MSNYKEQAIAGSKYQRACRIMIDNPLGETPNVTFIEEEVTMLPDGSKSHRLVGSLGMTFDPTENVTMIDPNTNLATTTVYPVSLAQWIIYSLYWKKAKERDNPPAITPSAPAGS